MAADTPVTAEALRRQPRFPADFEALTYPQRIDWLQRQLEAADSPVRRYQLVSERAFEHYANGANAEVVVACREVAPQAFHLEYRFVCAAADERDPAGSIQGMLDVHADAMAAGKVNLAVQVLSTAAWVQSAAGDVAGAFRSYEQALSLAEHASPETLNDVTLNTATLYVMHGDREYVQKGVALQVETIARFRKLKAERPDAAAYFDDVIALTQYNAGVAHALHLQDYARALHWFGRLDPRNRELRKSALVFSALSATELGRTSQARAWLAASRAAPASSEMDTAYLACYQELIKAKLNGTAQLAPCRDLAENTPLEVSLDIFKRMADLPQPAWRQAGMERLHGLFVAKLEPQLKQSSMRAASRAELSRLQLESKLNGQLLEKEQALKRAEQDKLRGQRLLTAAVVAILLLVLLVIALRLRHDRRLARQFLSMSVHDGLTGLHNRRHFEHHVEREINLVKRAQQEGTGQSIALCLFDIDHFKRINDSHGHDAGDAVLKQFAQRIKAVTRDSDLLVRWGGEEFLLLARLAHAGESHHIAERIRTVVATQPFTLPDQRVLDVTCTVGAVVYPRAVGGESDVPWQRLVQLADAALYLGKRKGRNCWVCIDNVVDTAALDRILAQDLEISVREGLIVLGDGLEPSGVASA
ncbi:diguanylate cyclase (GGDEF)-like protein [Lysobacter ruishenii]|uniref:diguanylate cyclase n=2 Tax=Aerolutibacter ruishenii TaxID=686800 RepID=A0A562LKR6_9GAMM|nr:diguanylate cyclase (GGDEF)-like protein [Lysobacter ruishenii]